MWGMPDGLDIQWICSFAGEISTACAWIAELVRRLDLQDAVRFEPYLDKAALHAELAQRGVYITASEHEGFGLSLVEALAAGSS